MKIEICGVQDTLCINKPKFRRDLQVERERESEDVTRNLLNQVGFMLSLGEIYKSRERGRGRHKTPIKPSGFYANLFSPLKPFILEATNEGEDTFICMYFHFIQSRLIRPSYQRFFMATACNISARVV